MLMIIWVMFFLVFLKLHEGRFFSGNFSNWVIMILFRFLDLILKFATVFEAPYSLIME